MLRLLVCKDPSMTKLGRPSSWSQHRDEMVRLYSEEEWSRGQIARHFDTSVQTVTRQLRAAEVALSARKGDNPNEGRTAEEQAQINAKVSASRKGKGTGPRVPREEVVCPECQTTFIYIPGKTGKTYCSRTCRSAATSRRQREEALEAYADSPVTCPCGEAIPYEYRHQRQFCSPDHRVKYQPKKKADPANYVTFTCQNETCGKEVTRYKNYGNGASMFCSNACSMKHTRTKRHVVMNDDHVVLDSKWEALFWGLMGFRKILCSRYDREQGVEWSEGHWYAPDFTIVIDGLEIAVEIKGRADDDDPEKWDQFRRERGRLVVLDEESLEYLLRIDVRRVLYVWATTRGITSITKA